MWARLWHRLRGDPRSLLELFALSGFAFTQPLFDVIGRSPEFFVFRQSGRREIVLLAVIITFLPATGLWALETAVGWAHAAARRGARVVIRAALLGVIGLQVLQSWTPLRGVVLVAASVVVAFGSVVLFFRHQSVRLWLRYLTPAPLVFAALFLVFSPVSDLVFASERGAAAAGVTDVDTPVVVMFFDELPLMSLLDAQGEVDRRLFPNFARLADRSSWFRNTTGVSSWTPRALPAMLSGRYPGKTKAPTASQHPETLFSLLDRSHDLVSFETITSLCPQSRCETPAGNATGGLRALVTESAQVWGRIMSPNEDRRDVSQSLQEETVSRRRQRFGGIEAVRRPKSAADATFGFNWLGENQPRRFQAFVESLDGGRAPTVWFLHMLLPHAPWTYLPSGLQYAPVEVGLERHRWTEQSDWPWTHALQVHLLQTVYTDSLLGLVLDRLEATGLYDRSLVVVAADHGAGFRPGASRRKLKPATAHQIAWVPFFVKAPHQQVGHVSDANVQVVDVLPTIADLLDVGIPWETDGISAVGDERRPGGAKPFYDEPRRIFQDQAYLPKVLGGLAGSIARPELGPEGLFRVGPYADLIGTRVGEHRLAGSGVTRPRARLDGGLAPYQHVDPGTGGVPAIVSGELKGMDGVEGRYSLAVALNGTIAAVSDVFPEREIERRFATIASDSSFRIGDNHLELFLVSETQGARGVILHPVALSD